MASLTLKFLTPGRLNALLVLIFGLLVTSGIKTFTIWTQITDIYYVCLTETSGQYYHNPLALFAMHDPHALRYLAMWPLIEMSYLSGQDFATTYPCYLLLVFYVTSCFLARILSMLQLSRNLTATKFDQPCIFAILLLVSLFMNGRLAMVFLGVSLILYAQLSFLVQQGRRIRLFLVQFLGLLFCSVSSGTFTVACCMVIIFQASVLAVQVMNAKKLNKPSLCYLVFFAVVCAPFMYIFALKNLSFFKYSLSAMLLHGAPEIFYSYGVALNVLGVVFAAYCAIILFATMGWNLLSLKKGGIYSPIILLIGLSLCLGIFGYSTLLTMLPALVVLGAVGYKQYLRTPVIRF